MRDLSKFNQPILSKLEGRAILIGLVGIVAWWIYVFTVMTPEQAHHLMNP